MNYKEVLANNGTIAIGHIGDNLATKVVFDVAEIVETYGSDGTFELLVKQQSSQGMNPYLHRKVYPVVIETDMTANTVTWIPTAEDTSSGQYMDVELVYTIEEQVVYDQIYRAVCKKSFANTKRGSAPESAWMTEVIRAGVSARQSAEIASSNATTASSAAESASRSASTATTAAESASRSASSAAQAATRAETAADSVTAATVAETKSYLGL